MDDLKNRLDMLMEIKRFQSFKKWPFSNKQVCNVQKLAEAGFFWTGSIKNPNSAQCFICNKELSGWEITDDPWEEHKKHAPSCPFVVIGKPEELLTLYQLHDLSVKMSKTCLKKVCEEQKDHLSNKSKVFREFALQYNQIAVTKLKRV